jgi:DNA-binding transcriptional MerR regulator
MDDIDRNPGDELIGSTEAGTILEVNPVTVVDWTNKGLIPVAMTTLGGHRRYRRRDIEALRDRMRAEAS